PSAPASDQSGSGAGVREWRAGGGGRKAYWRHAGPRGAESLTLLAERSLALPAERSLALPAERSLALPAERSLTLPAERFAAVIEVAASAASGSERFAASVSEQSAPYCPILNFNPTIKNASCTFHLSSAPLLKKSVSSAATPTLPVIRSAPMPPWNAKPL